MSVIFPTAAESQTVASGVKMVAADIGFRARGLAFRVQADRQV